MTREEAIHFATCLKNNWTINFTDMEEFCDIAIEALTQDSRKVTQESTQDLISRQDAIEAIESRHTEQWIESDIDYNSGLESALCEIKALPSAEPKTGKWVLKGHLWECDQCGCRINRANPLKGNIWNYNFCPNCGSRMTKGGEDE